MQASVLLVPQHSISQEKNVFEVESFLWLIVTGTREEHLPWAHKYHLSFLFYHRDHHRNNLKMGKKQGSHSNFFPQTKFASIN